MQHLPFGDFNALMCYYYVAARVDPILVIQTHVHDPMTRWDAVAIITMQPNAVFGNGGNHNTGRRKAGHYFTKAICMHFLN